MPHPRELADQSVTAVLKQFQSSRNGLTSIQVDQRRTRKNTLEQKNTDTLLRRFLRQFKSPLIYILLGVATLAPIIGEWSDALIIGAVLLLNALIGTYQEGKASEALTQLKNAFIVTTLVRRNGINIQIPTVDIVLGDLCILQAGDQIPADGRFISCTGLQVNESALTGESVPVNKTDKPLRITSQTPLGDIRNAGFRQTFVVNGFGELIVTAVGKDTEIGHIASLLGQEQTQPPLVKKIRILSRNIALTVAAFCAFLGIYGITLGYESKMLLATIASLAVSIIPEGLPVVLTLVLARGVNRMAQKNAIVKRPHAVEGLGNIDVICTDKTGTLTENKLTVSEVQATGKNIEELAIACQALGNEAHTNDPINIALAAFGSQSLPTKTDIQILEEIPFSFEKKYRSIRAQIRENEIEILAGAPEAVLALCDASSTKKIETTWQKSAKQGLRIIAIAKKIPKKSTKTNAWECLGFVGLSDSLRQGVIESINWCQSQNILVTMITGDHPDTALHIAKQANIATQANQVLTGSQVHEMTDQELASRVLQTRVFARITPEHKVRIVKAFQSQGKKTAMTGDGVNDAPALQIADIGIAMGKTGTDVAREAADIVLIDDHFATIVTAIQEGRAVIGNVRKVLTYLFSTSIGEALIISIALIGKWPIPLLPVQILWLNFITDGFLVVALAMEPTHYSHHYHHDGKLLDKNSFTRILVLGSVMAIGSLIVYINATHFAPLSVAQSMALLIMAMFQWVNIWSTRSESISIFKLPLFTNPYLIYATLIVIFLQINATYIPVLQKLLRIEAIPWETWITALIVSSSVIVADEGWKQWNSRQVRASNHVAKP